MEKDPCQAQVDLCQSLNQTFFYMAPYFVQIHPKMYIGSIHTGKDDPINIYFVLNGYQNSGAFHGQQGQSTEFLLAGLLGAFVTASYMSVIRRTSSDDIEKEFEKEILEEYRKQEKQAKR